MRFWKNVLEATKIVADRMAEASKETGKSISAKADELSDKLVEKVKK